MLCDRQNLALVGLDAADEVWVTAEGAEGTNTDSALSAEWLTCSCMCVCPSHDVMVAMSLLSDWEKEEATVLFFLRLMVLVLLSSSCFLSPASRPAMNCSRTHADSRHCR